MTTQDFILLSQEGRAWLKDLADALPSLLPLLISTHVAAWLVPSPLKWLFSKIGKKPDEPTP